MCIRDRYYSYQEEWERYFQEIQSLPNRAFYVKHKIEGGIIPLQTDKIAPAYELAGVSKEIQNGMLEKAQLGLKYLNPRGKPQLEEAKQTEKKPKSAETAKPGEKQKPKDGLPQGEIPPSGDGTKSKTLEE